MRRVFLAAMLFCGACGGNPDDGPCVPRSGLYKVTFVPRSGDCGAINESIINVDTPDDGSCMGTVVPKDVCGESTVDVTCKLAGASMQSMVLRGKVTWRNDATSGRAEAYIELRASTGLPLCNGIYSITYTKV